MLVVKRENLSSTNFRCNFHNFNNSIFQEKKKQLRIALKEKEEKEKERREQLEMQKQREIDERKR